jgi:hypothetical protein
MCPGQGHCADEVRRMAVGFSAVGFLTWDRCYDFLNIFAEKLSEKMAFLTQSSTKF